MRPLRHRRPSFAVILLAFALTGQAPSAPDAEYEALLARAKTDPLAVDLGQLRMALARSSRYEPHAVHPDGRPEMRQALEAKDWATVLRIADAALERNYLRIRPHIYAAMAARSLGDETRGRYHYQFVQALGRAIEASGDGRSPDTAIVVIDVEEGYDFLVLKGLMSLQQTAARAGERDFDVTLPRARSPFRPRTP